MIHPDGRTTSLRVEGRGRISWFQSQALKFGVDGGVWNKKEIRQKQHSDFSRHSINDIENCVEPKCTDRASLVAEQVAIGFTSK